MWGTLITLIALMVRGAREDVLTCEGRFPDATTTVWNPTLREETAKDGAPGDVLAANSTGHIGAHDKLDKWDDIS